MAEPKTLDETLDKKLLNTKTVKDVLDLAREGITKDHEKAFNEIEEFYRPKYQAHVRVNIIEPTIDVAYYSAISMLSGISDSDKVGQHKDMIKAVLMRYMETILEKEHPHVLELIKDLEGDDRIKVLAHYFDQFHPVGEGGNSLRALVQQLDQLKDTTIVEFKAQLSQIKDQNKEGAMRYLSSKVMQLYIGSMPEGVYHKLFLERLKQEGYVVEDPSKLLNLLTYRVDQLHRLHIDYLQKKRREERDIFNLYGLKRKQ